MIRLRRLTLSFFILCIIVFGTFPVLSQEKTAPVMNQVTYFINILGRARSIQELAGSGLNIGVVGTSDAMAQLDEIFTVLSRYKTRKAGAVQIAEIVKITYSDKSQLENEVKSKNIKALFVAPGNSGNINLISQITRFYRILSFTSVGEYVQKGISVGIDENSKLKVNPEAIEKEGINFDAAFKKMAGLK